MLHVRVQLTNVSGDCIHDNHRGKNFTPVTPSHFNDWTIVYRSLTTKVMRMVPQEVRPEKVRIGVPV